MPLTLHNLKPSPKSRRKRKRVGRGDASGRGTYSTRGLKGQKARSGGKGGLKLRGFKKNLQRIPKKRGFKSIYPKNKIVNVKDLAAKFEDNDRVTPRTLLKKGLIDKIKPGVKILGDGKLTRKLIVEDCAVSKSAKEKIEKAGGEVKQNDQ